MERRPPRRCRRTLRNRSRTSKSLANPVAADAHLLAARQAAQEGRIADTHRHAEAAALSFAAETGATFYEEGAELDRLDGLDDGSLLALVDRVPDGTVAWLYEVEGWPMKEVADYMGMPVRDGQASGASGLGTGLGAP